MSQLAKVSHSPTTSTWMSGLDDVAWLTIFDFLSISSYGSVVRLCKKLNSLFSEYKLFKHAQQILTKELPPFGTRKPEYFFYFYNTPKTILEYMTYYKFSANYRNDHILERVNWIEPNIVLKDELLGKFANNMYIAEYFVSKTKGKILVDAPSEWLEHRELMKSVFSLPKQGSWFILVKSPSIRSDLDLCKLAFQNRHPKVSRSIIENMIMKTEESQIEAIKFFGLECFPYITNKNLFSDKELMFRAIRASIPHKIHASSTNIQNYIPLDLVQTREMMLTLMEVSAKYILNCSPSFYEENMDLVTMAVQQDPEILCKLSTPIISALEYQTVKQCLQQQPLIFYCLPLHLRQTPELIYLTFQSSSFTLSHGNPLWKQICDGITQYDAIKAFADCGHLSMIRRFIKLTSEMDQKTLNLLLTDISLKRLNRFLSCAPDRPEFVFTKEYIFPMLCKQFRLHEYSFVASLLQYRDYILRMITLNRDPLTLDLDMIRTDHVLYFIVAFPIINQNMDESVVCEECRTIILNLCKNRFFNLSLMMDFIPSVKELILCDTNFVLRILEVNVQFYRILPAQLRNSKKYPELALKVLHDGELRTYVKGISSTSSSFPSKTNCD
ncbi:hypothetical protein FDP41_012596 [Naegleria fowleri]|uniref:F-box domain-containing protein n=1 Tax=Naegleria fowleri TaxID=5763 RepID=A0A6A5C0X8_NAEFO|nr:uncharacterized protein FDP41_012596 [Naegleria fowleri]KAF0981336.1 hypothetical protein FDP41_012596 [Naegleria fowleri]